MNKPCPICSTELTNSESKADRDLYTSLLPLLASVEIKPIVERSLADHCQLRALLGRLRQRDPESLGSFGKYLTDHVRFEERELVPLFEELLN